MKIDKDAMKKMISDLVLNQNNLGGENQKKLVDLLIDLSTITKVKDKNEYDKREEQIADSLVEIFVEEGFTNKNVDKGENYEKNTDEKS